ncbi:uncharacterized protein LOC107022110 [Solanum pennellii]|uniref:Uncharacterized protein LOC107022110 n=1 Tax=Solanum pennellii TaxID=28526 RepID=A0ABM1GZS9_SOLPN|nr:uncharacterized protein LOC107022110 [Solanum pennellii]
MSVEEYSLTFTMMSKYATSLVSKPSDEMSRFVMGVADLVREECCTSMLQDDMTLATLMVCAQSMEESKVKRMFTNLNISGPSEQDQPRFKKRAQNQEGPSAPEVKLEKGGAYQDGKPTCATCGKKHYGKKCLADTSGCFHCGKDDHKVRDCRTIVARGIEGKQVTPNVPGNDSTKAKARFYALRARGSKSYGDDDDDVGKF